jgi:hypothetical protein
MRIFILALLIFVAVSMGIGCGSHGRTVVVQDLGMRGAVLDLDQAVSEARSDLRKVLNWQATPRKERDAGEDEEGPPPEQLMLESTQMVESAAKQLVGIASGTNLQTDAQTMLAEAQELVKKANARAKPAELITDLDQLKSKVQELKSKI